MKRNKHMADDCIVYFVFRKEKGAIPKSGQMTEGTDYVPTILLSAIVPAYILIWILFGV